MRARAALAVALLVALAGCGGSGDSSEPAKQSEAPAEEGAPVPSERTPENCMLKAGLESVEKTKGTWIAFHPDGYKVSVKRFGSPAAANQAVEAAPGLAEQANFFGVFAPAEDQLNRSSLAVARCLRSF
jgi:ABC-type glycerol-3-phosphate transport system substrate-binding protein